MAHASDRRRVHLSRDSGAECTQTEKDESETSLKKCSQPSAMAYAVNHQETRFSELRKNAEYSSVQRRRENYYRDVDSSSPESTEPYRLTNPSQKPRRHSQKVSANVVYYKPTINHYNSSQSGTSQGSEEYDQHPPPRPCENRVYSTPYHGSGEGNRQDDGYITNAALRQGVAGSGEYATQNRVASTMQNSQVSDNETEAVGCAKKKEPDYGQVIVTASNNNLQFAMPTPDRREQVEVQIVMKGDGKQQTYQGTLHLKSVAGCDLPTDNPSYCIVQPNMHPNNVPHQSLRSTAPQQNNGIPNSTSHHDVKRYSQEVNDRLGQCYGNNGKDDTESRPMSYPANNPRLTSHQAIQENFIPGVPELIKRNQTPVKPKHTLGQVSKSEPDIRTGHYPEMSFWQRIGIGKRSPSGNHICHVDELVTYMVGEEKIIQAKNLLRQHGSEGGWFVTEAEHQPTHPYSLYVKLRYGNVASFPIHKVRSSNREKFTIDYSKSYKCICKLLEHYSSNNLPTTDLTIRQAFDILPRKVTHV